MNKEIFNEHDITKKMIKIISEGPETPNLNNADNNQPTTEDNDVETVEKNNPKYLEELKKISDSVDPGLQLTRFKIFPKNRNVELDGKLDIGINFFLSIKEMKLGISITDDQNQPIKLYVDKDVLAIIQRLVGYYDNWRREWAETLNTEYKSDNSKI